MRKVHYKVVLDVLVRENEDADINDALLSADFYPDADGDGDEFDVMDVNVETVEVIDSR